MIVSCQVSALLWGYHVVLDPIAYAEYCRSIQIISRGMWLQQSSIGCALMQYDTEVTWRVVCSSRVISDHIGATIVCATKNLAMEYAKAKLRIDLAGYIPFFVSMNQASLCTAVDNPLLQIMPGGYCSSRSITSLWSKVYMVVCIRWWSTTPASCRVGWEVSQRG